MPDPLIHFALPFALSSLVFKIRMAFLIGLIALLPDLDVIFKVHRSFTHSLLIIGLLTIPFILWNNRVGVAALLSLISHPIMDFFQTYTPILYPLIQDSLKISIDAGVIISEKIQPYITANLKSIPSDFKQFSSLDAPLFTDITLPISMALLFIPMIIKLRNNNFNNNSFKNNSSSIKSMVEYKDSYEDVTIVLPTLNEAQSIGQIIDALKSEGFNNIIVVDGYSSDGTPDIAKGKGVSVIYQQGIGKIGAISTALNYVKTPYMAVMDADGSYDPKDIKKLLSLASSYDEVIGIRDYSNMSFIHRIGNKILNFAFNVLLGKNLSDVCSGMYVLKTDAIKDLPFKTKGFGVEAEIAAHISYNGRIAEIPINYYKRIGKSKLRTFRDGLTILLSILWLGMTYNPVFLISFLGALLVIPGAGITIRELYLRYVYGAEAWSLGLAWAGLVLLIIGMQCLSMSMIALMLKRIEMRFLERLRK
ncbi:MAG: glycosyltransferase [Candidatus Methanomethyliaceae archaeon]|nr:glycosyltransferase [Candidatus Methanomethyliaceae archaeon]MDW7971363.1 glycosyltransferase [Nitrososphaerota archaeon]